MSKCDKTFSDIYGITVESAEKICPTEEWYIKLLKKKPEEIEIKDVTKMLINNIFIEVAIKKALVILSEDYMAGEFYDGHLLVLLSRIDLSKYDNEFCDIKSVINNIKEIANEEDWESKDEYEEYIGYLQKCFKSLKIN